MFYKEYFLTAKANQIPFGIDFNMLCTLEGIMSATEQELFFQEMDPYLYSFDGKKTF